MRGTVIAMAIRPNRGVSRKWIDYRSDPLLEKDAERSREMERNYDKNQNTQKIYGERSAELHGWIADLWYW